MSLFSGYTPDEGFRGHYFMWLGKKYKYMGIFMWMWREIKTDRQRWGGEQEHITVAIQVNGTLYESFQFL